MNSGVFIAGTDTGIGKTVLAAAFLHRYRRAGPLRYWKPVQTGWPADDDTSVVRKLAACREDEILDRGVRLPRPLSPHQAAELAGERIEPDALLGVFHGGAGGRAWVVEGAGGVLVPLNQSELLAGFMRRLGLPAVVAARGTLGTINHTLLTLEALGARDIQVRAVVMIGPVDPANIRAVEHFGGVPVVASMPRLKILDAGSLGGWARSELDPGGILEPLFGEAVPKPPPGDGRTP